AHGVARTVTEPDALQRGLDPPERVAPARRGDDLKVLQPVQMSVEARLLDDRADAGERLRATLRNRQAAKSHRAPVRAREPQQHPDKSRLAGAVRTEVSDRDAPRAPEVD